jgi:hypothetical protein
MKPAVLCLLLLLSACSDFLGVRNFRTYKLTWTCLSPEGCERTEQVVLIDRAEIFNDDDVVTFLSTRDDLFRDPAQWLPSDALPADCFWLHDVSFFVLDLEPGRFCRTAGQFELELSIPNRDPATHSEWLVNGREIDP